MTKKNRYIKLMSWSLPIIIFSAIFAFFAYKKLTNNKVNSNAINWTTPKKVIEKKTFNLDNIEEIYLQADYCATKIVPEDRKNIEVTFEKAKDSSKEKENINTELQGSILSISKESQEEKSYTKLSDIKDSVTYIYIRIPEKYYKNITINSPLSSIDIANLKINSLKLILQNGETTIQDSFITNFIFQSSSGKLYSNNLNTANSVIENDTGNINLKNFSGDLNSKNISGSTDILYKNFDNDVYISSHSGNIKLNIPENSSFYLDAKSSQKEVNTTFSLKLEEKNTNILKGTLNHPNNNITIRSDSGTINILKLEDIEKNE